ncbi:hypothetical protein F4553_004160 [Allocatelliglobosispora scoriae]|uniref:Histone deacetylase n=1 Tax=Allocatelliglobosispora scoriae TaxID=643052 RepID=A0A841BVL1_9ACTN|nr:histone deacetylase [Allocatelliglobosispora scoriae]MBB5870781.1 hypothetical protein [Allocatelliglobosispora scoriae]
MRVTPAVPASTTDQVWYVAYGSNMNLDRLGFYIGGGQPVGSSLTYPGCRDQRMPGECRPVMLPGQLYFALEAVAWTGGMGFYDPAGLGQIPARAYRISTGQLSDIISQEMCQEPGFDRDISEALIHGRMEFGPGCYETMLRVGYLDGLPMLTFTAPWRAADQLPNRPAGVYLRIILTGLMEAHGWSVEEAAGYLSSCSGASGHWSAEDVVALLVREGVPA